MSDSAVPAPSSDERAVAGTSSSVLGMVLFVASESMFFAAFFGAYVTTYVDQKVWPPNGTPPPPLGLPTAAVAVLALSGLLLQGALRASRRGLPETVSRWLVGTVVAGAVVLLGLVVVQSLTGRLALVRYQPVQAAAVYWNFVIILGLVIYVVFYVVTNTGG